MDYQQLYFDLIKRMQRDKDMATNKMKQPNIPDPSFNYNSGKEMALESVLKYAKSKRNLAAFSSTFI